MGIREHLAKWHTKIEVDTLADEEDWMSVHERFYKTSSGRDKYGKRQFIGVDGAWALCDEIRDWLEEQNIPFIINLDSTKEPYVWSLCFSDKGHAAMFKLRWHI